MSTESLIYFGALCFMTYMVVLGLIYVTAHVWAERKLKRFYKTLDDDRHVKQEKND